MSQPKDWIDKFEHLLQALADIEEQEGELITCEQCQENIDSLVTDRLAEQSVLRHHLPTILHLLKCPECRTLYATVLDTLLAERPKQPSPWHKKSGPPSQPFPLIFHIASEFVQRALRGPQLALARGDAAAVEELDSLLLSDIVPAEQGEIIAMVTLHRHVTRLDFVDLEVQLISDWALPQDIQAHLSWGGLELARPLEPSGTVNFDDIPIAQVTNLDDDLAASNLKLTFNATG